MPPVKPIKGQVCQKHPEWPVLEAPKDAHIPEDGLACHGHLVLGTNVVCCADLASVAK